MTSLLETQRLLLRLITAPEGVEPHLAESDSRDRAERQRLHATVRDGRVLKAADCVDVYGSMYFFRILDVLRDDFPAVTAALGDDAFHNLVTDYLLTYPSSHPSLREAGRHLPEFVRGHSVNTDYPFLEDLARFEWIVFDTFDGPDAATASARDLQRVQPGNWGDLRLRLHPSVTLAAFAWPVRQILAQFLQRGAGDSELVCREEQNVCVWRKDFRVLHRQIDLGEWSTLQRIAAGDSFLAVCETAEETLGEDAAVRVAGLLARWLADGLVQGVAGEGSIP